MRPFLSSPLSSYKNCAMNTVEIVSANEGNTAENLTNLFKRDYHVCRVLETASESNVLI